MSNMWGNPEFLAVVFSVLVASYHVGAWRQRVDNGRNGIAAQMAQFREVATQNFARIDARFDGVERQLRASQDIRAADERWKGVMESKLDGHDGRILRLEHAEVV